MTHCHGHRGSQLSRDRCAAAGRPKDAPGHLALPLPLQERGGALALDAYMRLPTEQYSELDPSMIHPLGNSAFLLKVPRVQASGPGGLRAHGAPPRVVAPAACSLPGGVPRPACAWQRRRCADSGTVRLEGAGLLDAATAQPCVLLLRQLSLHPQFPLQLFDVWLEPEVTVHVRQQEGPVGLVFEAGECRSVSGRGAFSVGCWSIHCGMASCMRCLSRPQLWRPSAACPMPQASGQRPAAAPWAGQAFCAALPHRCVVAAAARQRRPDRRQQPRSSGVSAAAPARRRRQRRAGAD